MSTTPRLGIPYPAGADIDNVPQWMHDTAVVLDGIIPPYSSGAIASRPVSSVPSPGINGRLYYANDVDPATVPDRQAVDGVLYLDTGTGYVPVGPQSSKFAMGFFNSPGATGNQDYVGIGFQPKFVEFGSWNTALDGTASTNMEVNVGGMSASAQYAQCGRSHFFGGGTGAGFFRFMENRCIVDLANDGTINWAASFAAMLADGFRLNWNTTPGTGLRVVYKAWG